MTVISSGVPAQECVTLSHVLVPMTVKPKNNSGFGVLRVTMNNRWQLLESLASAGMVIRLPSRVMMPGDVLRVTFNDEEVDCLVDGDPLVNPNEKPSRPPQLKFEQKRPTAPQPQQVARKVRVPKKEET